MVKKNQPEGAKRKYGTGFVVAAAVVGVAVVLGTLGILALVLMPDKNDAATGTRPTSSARPTNAPPAAAGCDVPSGNITVIPADLSWTASQGATWPISKSLGPTSTKDGFPVCFSRSPVGAALAASSILFAQVDHTPASAGTFYTVDSPGKALSLTNASGPSKLVTSMQQYGLQFVGFRIDEYTDDRAAVLLVFSSPNAATSYVGMPFPVVWVDGDWRLKVRDDGTTGPAVPVNEGQFTKWATSNG